MEKDTISYLIIIVLLVAILGVVGSFALNALNEPSKVTELSFIKGSMLPNMVSNGETYTFSFSINNLGDSIKVYDYTILSSGTIVEENMITIDGGKQEIIKAEFPVVDRQSGDEIQVAIQLKGLDQQIQQWVTVI